MRVFSIDDQVVRRNLQALERLSDSDCRDGDFRLVDALICSTIDLLEVLPRGLREKIRSSGFYVGDTHVRMSNEERVRLWSRLSKALAEDLERLSSDASLLEIDLTDRPKTKGELIEEICDRLEVAYDNGGDMQSLALQLERAGAGTAARADGRALSKLLAKKRIPDMAVYRSEIYRLIHHARLVGGQFYGRHANL